MTDLSVSQALNKRRSIRHFLPKAVDEHILRELLNRAARSPSNSNMQPCKIYAFTNQALQQSVDQFMQLLQQTGGIAEPEYPVYPTSLGDEHKKRRNACGETMYQSINIPREDKAARMEQLLKNYQFFDAPIGLIITMDNHMDLGQAIDIGILLQSIMLLACEFGLATCPQAAWSQQPDSVRQAFNIPQHEKIMVGMSMGYPNDIAPINQCQQPRISVDEFTTFSGF